MIFLLSPRIIDFDTYLPTAVALKAARPDLDIRFVTFSRANFDFILRSETMAEGLRRSGPLYHLGSDSARSRLAAIARRLCAFLLISYWTLASRRPIVFLGVPFTQGPYAVWYLLARIRGGLGLMLWKVRSPDISLHRVRQARPAPVAARISPLARLIGRGCDGMIHYHGSQYENIRWASKLGNFDGVPWLQIGMPHLLAPWQRLVTDEVQRAREVLAEAGIPRDAEVYCMFAAKPFSGTFLRPGQPIEMSFDLALRTLCRSRPNAVVLIRPHPLAVNEPYIRDGIAAVGATRARISFIHPEVLIALSRRAIFNNPTNVLFTCYPGKFIDVSDYSDEHFVEFGEVSLADGFGPLYVNPRATDFAERFNIALADDQLFDNPRVTEARDKLLQSAPANIDSLLAWFDREGPPSGKALQGRPPPDVDQMA